VTFFAGQFLPRMLRNFFHICRENVAGKILFSLFSARTHNAQANMTAA
jgi:hypothetical protein